MYPVNCLEVGVGAQAIYTSISREFPQIPHAGSVEEVEFRRRCDKISPSISLYSLLFNGYQELFPWGKADHSPPSSGRGQECVELYLQSPTRLHGVVLS